MIEHKGYWYPFMNEVASHNLGYGNEMQNALELVKDWSVAIDGGAQVGRVANKLAEKFGKVYAIEIARENFDCLVKNIKANVTPVRACLTDSSVTWHPYAPDKHPDSPVYRATDARLSGVQWPGDEKEPVHGLCIDELPLKSCGFIKLDLQGYDYFALRGAVQTLKRFKPVVYFEYDPSCFERYGVHKNAHQLYLESLGYKYIGTDDGNQIWA